jgi:hypothetical protein
MATQMTSNKSAVPQDWILIKEKDELLPGET